MLIAFGSRSDRPSERTESEEVSREPVQLPPELLSAQSGQASSREAEAAGAHGPEKPPLGDGSPTSAGLTRLAGILLRALDRSPVPHASLAFHFGDEMAPVVTDEGGRFETEFVVPAGVVRAYHAGTQTSAGFGQHRELEPTLFVVPETSSSHPVHEIELALMEPVATLDVHVLRNGAPAQASVGVTLLRRGWSAATDELGRVQLEFGALEPNAELRLVAHGEHLMSRKAELRFPWPDEVVVLELEPAGAIRVRTLDPQGTPLSRRYVSIPEAKQGEFTDADGVAFLKPVLAGPATVVAWGSEPRTVMVQAGGVAEIDLVLSEVRRRIVSGSVVDEEGNGLARIGLVVRSGYTSGTVLTEQDGSFEVGWPSDSFVDLVHVEIGQSADEDRYEPEEITVPLGTTELVLRRVASKPSVELSFLLIDARTRQPVEEGRVIVLRERLPCGCEASPTRDGLVVCSFKPFDDVVFVGRAPGYRDRSVSWRDLEREERNSEPVTLALEPGFAQTFQLVDCATDQPIAGARILEEREGVLELLALTDGEGQAHLELARWPGVLHALADGYESDSLLCSDYLDDALLAFCLDQEE